MKRLIDFADGVIPEGWEPVAYRVPEAGDEYVMSTGGVVMSRDSSVPDGPRVIVVYAAATVTDGCAGQLVLVSNDEKGQYVQRVLVGTTMSDRQYPFVCEAIDPRLPHQCWRFARRLVKPLTD